MTQRTVPFQVERALEVLGYNIKTARLRRNMSLQEMAERLGMHRTVLSDAERGKPGTAVAVYAGMLWAMDMLPDLQSVADPDSDRHGLALARSEERERVSAPRGMNNDF